MDVSTGIIFVLSIAGSINSSTFSSASSGFSRFSQRRALEALKFLINVVVSCGNTFNLARFARENETRVMKLIFVVYNEKFKKKVQNFEFLKVVANN